MDYIELAMLMIAGCFVFSVFLYRQYLVISYGLLLIAGGLELILWASGVQ